MKHLLKVCLTVLVIGIALIGMGQNGCPVGIGYWSNQDEATLTGSSQPVPSAVTNLRITTMVPHNILLSWQDNSNNEIGILIERKNELSGDYIEIASVDANKISYYDSAISPSTTYYYRVRAQNDNGYSMYSNEASVTTLPEPPPPPPPIPPIPYNLCATSTIESQVDLSWREDYDGLVDFPIQCRVGTDTAWAQIDMLTIECDPEIAIEFSDVGVFSPTATYFYRVGASNETGQSDWSDECWIIMPVE